MFYISVYVIQNGTIIPQEETLNCTAINASAVTSRTVSTSEEYWKYGKVTNSFFVCNFECCTVLRNCLQALSTIIIDIEPFSVFYFLYIEFVGWVGYPNKEISNVT